MFQSNHSLNKKGVSLIEVIIAALIFSITSAGLFSTFSAQRIATERSQRQLQAAYYARQVLEELRAKVDQQNWDSGDLSIGTHNVTSGIFTASYEVTEDSTGLRRVNLTVTWNEP